MAPTVILIRHAQAEHNATRNYQLPDPPLTTLGFTTQCDTLKSALQSHPLAQKISLIVVSPLRRTLQTATQALSHHISTGVPVVLRAEWQENSAKPCDTGTAISQMSEEWSQYDWSTVDTSFPSKEGKYEFTEEALTARGEEARRWLRERKEEVVAVVSHAGFLRVGVCYRRFENADYRIFDFAEDGMLVEREETELKGGGLGLSPVGVVGFEEGDRDMMRRFAVWKAAGRTPEEIPNPE